MTQRRWTGACALVLTVLFALPVTGWIVPGDGARATALREIVYWAISAVLILFVVAVERRPLSSIGLRAPGVSTVLFGLLGGAVAFGGIALLYIFVLPKLGTDYGAKFGAVAALPMLLRVELVARAAVFEELFYRGFMIEHLTPLLRSRWIAALVSLAAFVAAHLGYWGWGSLLTVSWGGLVLTALYLWRRDLGANMLAHALTDGIALLT